MTIPTFLVLAALSISLPAGPAQRQVLSLDDGSGLRYAIAVPEGYDGSEDVPLILALHYGWGGGTLPPDYSATFLDILVEPALRDLGAIIVAPLCPGRSWADPRSEEGVFALLEYVRGTYSVDADRVVVTGFSLGGMGTWYFASRYTEMFSAAIPLAGVPVLAAGPDSGTASTQRYSGAGSVAWPERITDLPIYVLHSRDDELIAIEPVEAAVAELEAMGVAVEFFAIDAGIGHHETARYVPYLQRAVPWVRDVWAGRR